MNSRQRNLLPRIKAVIEHVAPGTEIILYGSMARGEETENSDIDLLIVVDRPQMTRREKDTLTEPLIDLELETGISIGTIVRTRSEWEMPPVVTQFIINVKNEGVRL